MKKHTLGKLGEEFAKNFMTAEGYEILCSNFNCALGEIDLIAKKEEKIVFVEVKTRISQKFGLPSDAVDAAKRRKIVNTARYFLAGYKGSWSSVDFQVMEIMVRHHEGLDFTDGQYVIQG